MSGLSQWVNESMDVSVLFLCEGEAFILFKVLSAGFCSLILFLRASGPSEFDGNSFIQREHGTFMIWHNYFQKETLILNAI